MNATPVCHSSTARPNNAYIEVPPSPLGIAYRHALLASPHVGASSNLKENTPRIAFDNAPSTSLKRKLAEREQGSVMVFDGVVLKKTKTFPSPLTVAPLKTWDGNSATNTLPERAKEVVYCHQCCNKRQVHECVVCTFTTSIPGDHKRRKCKAKYCKSCLRNRYGEDVDALGSMFKCPRCSDKCTCSRCRKSKGLLPVGPLPVQPKKGQAVKQPKTSKAALKDVTTSELPTLQWNRVPIALTQEEAEQRIFIREFVFRFGDFLDPVVAKIHLEELELVGGRYRKNGDTGANDWIGEASLRAIVLGLLGALAKDREATTCKILKASVKSIRGAGNNLNKIWACLSSLRAEIASSPKIGSNKASFTFPDPSPLPGASEIPPRSLRNFRMSETVNVVQSSQMIPVVESLIHSLLESAAIREEIDRGLKDGKDITSWAREATRIETERWEVERKDLEAKSKDNPLIKAEIRAKRTIHRERVASISNALKIAAPTFACRFMPLGIDNDGRTYYALSPGHAEREAALEYLEVASSGKVLKLKKKDKILAVEERRDMRDWPWFIGVWGTKPPLENGAVTHPSDSEMVDTVDSLGGEHEDMAAARWWGFWDTDEILKLVQWLTIKSGITHGDGEGAPLPGNQETTAGPGMTPKVEHLKHLVSELKNYSALLKWRVKEEKFTVFLDPRNDSSK